MSPPKYTRPEYERRFVVRSESIKSLLDTPYWTISDRYLALGRLRLRRIVASDTGRETYKLCKKFAAPAGEPEPMVNIYLDRAEYAGFLGLPGSDLVKRRYHHEFQGRVFGVDVFQGELTGLVLCEIEAASAAELAAVEFPPYVVRDVTRDPVFTGGSLCKASASDVRAALAGTVLT